MTIRPTTPGTTGRADAARAVPLPVRDDANRRPAERRATGSTTDEVRISDQARDLQLQAAPDSIPHDEVAPERLRSITQRIEQGHYELPEVIDEVLRRMARDL